MATLNDNPVGVYRMSKATAHKLSKGQYLVSQFSNDTHLIYPFRVHENWRISSNSMGYRNSSEKVITGDMVEDMHALSKFIPVKDAIEAILNKGE